MQTATRRQCIRFTLRTVWSVRSIVFVVGLTHVDRRSTPASSRANSWDVAERAYPFAQIRADRSSDGRACRDCPACRVIHGDPRYGIRIRRQWIVFARIGRELVHRPRRYDLRRASGRRRVRHGDAAAGSRPAGYPAPAPRTRDARKAPHGASTEELRQGHPLLNRGTRNASSRDAKRHVQLLLPERQPVMRSAVVAQLL